MNQLKLISFSTKLYIAARNLQEFKRIKQHYKQKNVKEWIYWPILAQKEGYWISPFSSRKALQRIFQELQHQKSEQIPVMLDLELPTTRNPFLYFTESWHFFQNKHLITHFIQNYNGKIYLAEYYPEGRMKEKMLQWLGLHYSSPKPFIIKMMYHSLHHFNEEFVRKELQRGKKEWGKQFIVGFGTIAKGINGTEKILSSDQLQQDLKVAKQENISEVVIFRLRGLNQKYISILKKYSTPIS